jgi:hypothetical protein
MQSKRLVLPILIGMLAGRTLAGTVAVKLVPQRPAAQSCRIRQIVVEALCPAGEHCEVAAHTVPVPSSPAAVLSVDRPSRLVIVSDGCWAAPVTVTDAAAATQAEVPVWPGAHLRGSLTNPSHADLPKRLTARVQGAPRFTPAISPADVTCGVEGGRWDCLVPSAALDVRVSADGYAPVYLWDMHFDPGEQRDIGSVELRRGASVVGWVAPASGVALRKVTVELVPRGFGSPDESKMREGARGTKTIPNHRGFFEFQQVPAGTYDVVARLAGHSPGRKTGLRVDDPGEYAIERLVLSPLTRIEVAVDPPAGPENRPWTIVLERQEPLSPFVASLARASAGPDGRWVRENLEAGPYIVSVLDPLGSTLQRKTVNVTPEGTSLDIRLDQVLIRGTVSAGAERMPGFVSFEGTGGSSIRIRTDDQGSFSGMLPREGKWNVKIKSLDSRFYVNRRDIEVRRREGERIAVVDINLPGGRIKGIVLDERGEPSTADVIVYRDGHPMADIAAAEDGTFEMTGIESGEASLRAVSHGAASEVVAYQVTQVAPPVAQLVLRKLRSVKGWLTTSDGLPVPGALVRYFAAGNVARKETVTDLSGEFALDAGADTSVISLAVLAPSLPIKVATIVVTAEQSEPVHLSIGRGAGALRMLMDRDVPTPWLQTGGLPIPATALIYPPDGSGAPRGVRPDGLELEMESGSYSICADPRGTRCRLVHLAPGSEQVIDVRSDLAPQAKSDKGGL